MAAANNKVEESFEKKDFDKADNVNLGEITPDNDTSSKQVSDSMHRILCLAKIRNEIELLSNPVMRGLYEDRRSGNDGCEIYFKERRNFYINAKVEIKRHSCYVVALETSNVSQIHMFEHIKNLINESCTVHMCATLQTVFNKCHPSDRIYLSPGKHYTKYREYFGHCGSLIGISDHPLSSNAEHGVCVATKDDDSILLDFDGDFILENLILNCENTRIGLFINSGHIKLKNCHLIGDSKSSTQQAMVLCGNAQLTMDDCIVENFFTGITLEDGTNSTFNKLQVRNCQFGIEINAINTKVLFNDVHITDSAKCGIYANLSAIRSNQMSDFETFNNLEYLKSIKPYTEFDLTGECDFKNCQSNVYITNKTTDVDITI